MKLLRRQFLVRRYAGAFVTAVMLAIVATANAQQITKSPKVGFLSGSSAGSLGTEASSGNCADPNVDIVSLLLAQADAARSHLWRNNDHAKSSRRKFRKVTRIGSFRPGFDFLIG